jgi:hypothetical protein
MSSVGPGSRIIPAPGGAYFLTSSLARVDAMTHAVTSLLPNTPSGGAAVAFLGSEIIAEPTFSPPETGGPATTEFQGGMIERLTGTATDTSLAKVSGYFGGLASANGSIYVSKEGLLIRVDLATGHTSTITLTGVGAGSGYNRMVGEPSGTLLGLTNGGLVRIDPASGAVTVIGPFSQPSDIALVASNPGHALVGDQLNGKLLRVSTTDGSYSVLVSSFPGNSGSSLGAIAVEPGDQKALVSGGAGIYEVDLASGNTRVAYRGRGGSRMAVSSDGSFALIMDGGFVLLDLKSWIRTRFSLAIQADGLLLESGDKSFLTTKTLPGPVSGAAQSSVDRVQFR